MPLQLPLPWQLPVGPFFFVVLFLIPGSVLLVCIGSYPKHVFSGCSGFSESSFFRVNLYESNLEGGNFEKSNFTSANLTRVNFSGSSLIDSNFTNSNLFEANLTGANILNSNFEGANLSNTTWVDGKKCKLESIGNCKK